MSYLTELQKATNKGTTENGCATNISSLNPCLDFFALGAAKRARLKEAVSLFKKAYATDKTTALRTLFYIRDIRGGQGERDIFRACMEELDAFDIENAQKVYKFIPEYGRYDDLLYNRAGNKVAVQIVKDQLEKDLKSDNPSLLAKWLPSQNTSSKVTRLAGKNWAKALGMTDKEYRKALSKLRKKIHLLEQDMSTKKWGEIEYDKVPSQAHRKHVKAFVRNDGERYKEYLDEVKNGGKKLNTSTVTTSEVIANVRALSVKELDKTEETAVNTIWDSLDDVIPKDLNGIVVADVSGSMYSGKPRPLDISVSLALYFAERNKGVFANKFLTFSENPRLAEVRGETLTQKLDNIENAEWGMNTNIERTFDCLLQAAVASGDTENIPKVIYVISDMEFDYCVTGASETAFENARRKWNEKGLELPTVVFWNVQSRGNNLPAIKFDKNVVLISGSNQNAFRFAFEGKTPEDLMFEVINSDRYKQIVV